MPLHTSTPVPFSRNPTRLAPQSGAVSVCGALIALLLTASTPACAPPAEVDPPTDAAPSRDNVTMDCISFTLYSPRNGPARLVTVEPKTGNTLFVEATGPNLEIASIVRVTRGALDPGTARELDAAVTRFRAMDPARLEDMIVPEAIEHRGRLAHISAGEPGQSQSWFSLDVASIPAGVASALERSAAEADAFTAVHPPAIVQLFPVSPERAQKIRTDPRAFYTFVPIDLETLDASAALRSASVCSGSVVTLTAPETEVWRGWLRQSNPKGMGPTLFFAINDGSDPRTFQASFRELAAR